MTTIAVVVLVMALIIWGLFFLTGAPLNLAETTVVVGACFLIAFAVRKVVQILRRRPAADKSTGQ